MIGTFNFLEHSERIKKKRIKIAAFALEHTLIGRGVVSETFAKDRDFVLWHSCVPNKLRDLHLQGFTLAILANEPGCGLGTEKFKEV